MQLCFLLKKFHKRRQSNLENILFQKLIYENKDIVSNIVSNHCAITELLMVQSSGLGVFEPEICMSEGYNLLFEILLN